MSFDALLAIVFILFFVVGPLLRRLGGGGTSPGQPTSQRPKRPQGDSRSPDREAPEAGGEGDNPLSQRLEEARRRVQEAMGERDEPSLSERKASTSQQRPVQTPRELDWQASAAPVKAFLEPRERPARRRVGERGTTSAPVRTERRDQRRRPAKLRLGRRPELDDNGILNGVIWHEILSEPVSKRGTRRQPSRLRSR